MLILYRISWQLISFSLDCWSASQRMRHDSSLEANTRLSSRSSGIRNVINCSGSFFIKLWGNLNIVEEATNFRLEISKRLFNSVNLYADAGGNHLGFRFSLHSVSFFTVSSSRLVIHSKSWSIITCSLILLVISAIISPQYWNSLLNFSSFSLRSCRYSFFFSLFSFVVSMWNSATKVLNTFERIQEPRWLSRHSETIWISWLLYL